MISLEMYRKDPCGALSIPYWKAKDICLPEGMEIIHHRDFSPAMAEGCDHEVYFRLRHDLEGVGPVPTAGFDLSTASLDDMGELVSVINRSYPDLRVSLAQLEGYTRTPVYAGDLWLLAREAGGPCVGCALADCDSAAGEAALEWVQVLPSHRGRGLGRAMVLTLLDRARRRASFATVSGRTDRPGGPEGFYRKCGFTGGDLWHILRPRQN